METSYVDKNTETVPVGLVSPFSKDELKEKGYESIQLPSKEGPYEDGIKIKNLSK